MNTTLEPREVDKPCLRRWLRDTLDLFVRSPLRFGVLIAALGWLDTSAVNMTEGLVIEKQWVQRFGMVLLPAVWTAVSAVARGADDASQTWAAIRSLARRRVWSGPLTIGAVIAGLNWIVSWSLGGLVQLMVPVRPAPYLHHSGELLESTGVNAVLVFAFVGLCYFPLLVLIPDISSSTARNLSRRASSLNDHVTMLLFVGTTALIADGLASVAPAYGMTMAASIVFLGVFNYVAYRDIFERRSGNLPKAVVSAAGADAPSGGVAVHVVIGGGSGFIGTALSGALRTRGDRVTIISRHPGEGRITWEHVRPETFPACDAVVNLTGKHILDVTRRWTSAYRSEVISSRVETTKMLVAALNGMSDPPDVFISTAGKCFYGTGETGQVKSYPELTEDSEPMGIDFPAELVALWEKAAEGIDREDIRHVRVRIGVVLGSVERKSYLGRLWRIGRARGFLPIIRLPFCVGLGAVIGHGNQPLPWIHIDDMVRLLLHLIDNRELSGRFNAVSPGIVNNRQFMESFASHLRRPIVWSVPAWLVKRIVGPERASILLEGQNVKPKRTIEAGFKFRYVDIDSALDDLVQITI